MPPSYFTPLNQHKKNMAFPPQTKYIIGNEACERFSFYGMRSILTLFMVNVLMMSESEAVEVAHLFNAAIYLLPLLGAWVADKLLGRYRTILYVSLFYCLGNAVLASTGLTEDSELRRIILFTGLTIIAIGAGGIKPCVSAFVGDQMPGEGEEHDRSLTRMYAAFYWSINLGSFFSFLIIPWVRQNYGYSWAFGIPGIFMAVATLFFWLGRKHYLHRAPEQPRFLPALFSRLFCGSARACERFGNEEVARATNTAIGIAAFIVVAPLVLLLGRWSMQGAAALATLSGAAEGIASLCGLAALLLYVAALVLASLRLAASFGMRGFFGVAGSMLFCKPEELAARYSEEDRKGARNMARILTVFAMIIPFWSLFDQTTSSWILQGRDMVPCRITESFTFGAEEMQSINPLLVMIFVPLLTLLVYPVLGKWSTPLRRMGLGICLAGLSYGAVATIQLKLDGGAQLSILWQSIPYFMLTIAEILVSTTGLEYAYKAAGKNLKSIVSSFFFLTSTLGNFLVVFIASMVSDPAAASTFCLYGGMCVAIGLLFIFVTSRPGFQAEE